MITQKVKIINKLGLHARASAKLVSLASRFQSTFNVTKNNQTINGKSIMSVMTLAANQGCELVLSMDGADEKELATAVTHLIETRFGEVE